MVLIRVLRGNCRLVVMFCNNFTVVFISEKSSRIIGGWRMGAPFSDWRQEESLHILELKVEVERI